MSAPRKRVVLLNDPDYQPDEGARMEFRLTYAGPLYATQPSHQYLNRDKRAGHKQELRRCFHRQLKKLWHTFPAFDPAIPRATAMTTALKGPAATIDELALEHSMFGFNFVPLVTEKLSLMCGVEILFLRNQRPGDIVVTGQYGGDVDNRMKTLLDALSVPVANEKYIDLSPSEDEKPFFCLLEDDKLLSKIAIETDHLLEDITDGNENDVRLIIKVSVRPYDVSLWNLHFA